MKNIEIVYLASQFVSKNNDKNRLKFQELIDLELEKINGIHKKERYLNAVALELRTIKNNYKKDILIKKEKNEKMLIHQKIEHINDLISLVIIEKNKIHKLRESIVLEESPKIEEKPEVKEQENIVVDLNYMERYSIDLVIANFCKYINSDYKKENLYRYTIDLNEYLIDYIEENKKFPDEFYLLLDQIHYKFKNTEKKSEERKVVRNIFNTFKNTYKIYKEKENQKKESPYFPILNYLLNDEEKYLQIKQLVERKREICNLKYQNHHILIYILDLYISNFKKMIHDKNSDYININYLKQVYFLFSKNYSLRISVEDKKIIDFKLKEFAFYIKSTLIKQKRKNAALEDIKQLKTKNFYKIILGYEYLNFTDDNLGYEKNNIQNNMINYTSNKPITKAFLVGGNAYKITKEDGYKLTMYAIDIHFYAQENSLMVQYLEKCLIEKEKIDEFTSKNFNFEKDKKYSVIKYELSFYPSGKIKKLTVGKDIIEIDKSYFHQKASEDAELIYELYQKSLLKNGGEGLNYDFYKLNEHFESILSKCYIEFLRQNRLPYIYYGYKQISSNEVENIINNISNYTYKLTKKDAVEVVNILTNQIDHMHFSILPIDNGVYQLDLIHNFTYLGIENTRMLGDLYFNERLLSEIRLRKLKEEYLKKYVKKVDELNTHMDYVDPTMVKLSKGKIKNKVHL